MEEDGTYIGASAHTVKMTFEPFNSLPPPAVPSSATEHIELEPDLENFSRSIDPIEVTNEEADDAADNILSTDHTFRRIAENDDDPDLGASSPFQQIRNEAAITYTAITTAASKGNMLRNANAYLFAAASASSSSQFRRQSDESSGVEWSVAPPFFADAGEEGRSVSELTTWYNSTKSPAAFLRDDLQSIKSLMALFRSGWHGLQRGTNLNMPSYHLLR